MENLFNSRDKVTRIYDDYFLIISEAKYYSIYGINTNSKSNAQ